MLRVKSALRLRILHRNFIRSNHKLEFTESFVGDNPKLELLKFGEQPKFLLVHGSSTQAKIWLPLMQALAIRGIASAAVSLRSHGKSEPGLKFLHKWNINDYVKDVTTVVEALQTPVALVGHSMGGLISQIVATQRDTTKGLVLLGSFPAKGMATNTARLFAKHPIWITRTALSRSLLTLFKNPNICHEVLFSPSTPRHVVLEVREALQEESWRATYQMATLAPNALDVVCPVFVIAGEDDFTVDGDSVKATCTTYGTKPVFLPQCGHMIPIEADPFYLAGFFQNVIDFCWPRYL